MSSPAKAHERVVQRQPYLAETPRVTGSRSSRAIDSFRTSPSPDLACADRLARGSEIRLACVPAVRPAAAANPVRALAAALRARDCRVGLPAAARSDGQGSAAECRAA